MHIARFCLLALLLAQPAAAVLRYKSANDGMTIQLGPLEMYNQDYPKPMGKDMAKSNGSPAEFDKV